MKSTVPNKSKENVLKEFRVRELHSMIYSGGREMLDSLRAAGLVPAQPPRADRGAK